MRIRHPWVIKTIGMSAAFVVRLWMRTLCYRYFSVGPSVDPHEPNLPCRYIYSLWHEAMLFPLHLYSCPQVTVLASQHADGQLLTEVCRHLRVRFAQGSTTRGGIEGVRKMLRRGRDTHLAITPDGPRGPRRRVQPGVIYLASRTGLPIIPLGFGFGKLKRLKSWDRFALPCPWTIGACVSGAPIHVPADADKSTLEGYRDMLERAMHWATSSAEAWARAGIRPRAAEFLPNGMNSVLHRQAV